MHWISQVMGITCVRCACTHMSVCVLGFASCTIRILMCKFNSNKWSQAKWKIAAGPYSIGLCRCCSQFAQIMFVFCSNHHIRFGYVNQLNIIYIFIMLCLKIHINSIDRLWSDQVYRVIKFFLSIFFMSLDLFFVVFFSCLCCSLDWQYCYTI